MLSCSVMPNSLQPRGLYPTRLLCPWDFPGKNTGVGCHFLLWGLFLTQGSNPHSLHWQVDSLLLSHWGSLSTHSRASVKHVGLMKIMAYIPWDFTTYRGGVDKQRGHSQASSLHKQLPYIFKEGIYRELTMCQECLTCFTQTNSSIFFLISLFYWVR